MLGGNIVGNSYVQMQVLLHKNVCDGLTWRHTAFQLSLEMSSICFQQANSDEFIRSNSYAERKTQRSTRPAYFVSE
jgi:hypothetical protein